MPSLLFFMNLAFRFADTLEWDALTNNLRFQKILAGPRAEDSLQIKR
jgi:hypothetical protein